MVVGFCAGPTKIVEEERKEWDGSEARAWMPRGMRGWMGPEGKGGVVHDSRLSVKVFSGFEARRGDAIEVDEAAIWDTRTSSSDKLYIVATVGRATQLVFRAPLRRKMPLTQPVNHNVCMGNAHAMIKEGAYEPPKRVMRLDGRAYETRRTAWRTMRVVKKEAAKRKSDRRRGCRHAIAIVNVGS